MKRFLITAFLLVVHAGCFAGGTDVEKLVTGFNQALVRQDTITLRKMLHDRVIYGHSNGWVQTKDGLVRDMFNGKLSYLRIERAVDTALKNRDRVPMSGGEVRTASKNGKTRIFKADYQIDCMYHGEPRTFRLNVMYVWIKEKGTWQLIGRHSTKI